MKTQLLSLVLVLFVAACTPSASALSPAGTSTPDPLITPTECGCDSIYGPNGPTPTAAFVPAGPQPESTPADVEQTSNQWVTYRSETYGFSFEYPAVYQQGDFGFCAPREQSDRNALEGAVFSISVGSRTTLTLWDAQGQSLESAAETFRTAPARAEAQFDPPQQRTVAGQPALTLPYRSGGTDHFAEATLWIEDGTLFVLETGTPSACDVPAVDLREINAYQHVLDTFQ